MDDLDKRTGDFMLYVLLEQEKKLFEKTKQSASIITNPIPLWYSYSSAFASTTMSMRIPLWFVCSIWTVWKPDLYLYDIGRIVPSPDTQGASLALLASLDLPEGLTPARHITGLAKLLRELVLGWNRDRAKVLYAFSLAVTWEALEPHLAQFYLVKIQELAAERTYLDRAWSLSKGLEAEMPQDMTQLQIKQYILGSPIK